MQVEITTPEKIDISKIREHVTNVEGRSVDVHLENGKSYTLKRQGFLDFWFNTMTASQRVVVLGYIEQTAALASKVSQDKVTGGLGE